MSSVVKNLISLPITYLVFTLIFVVTDLLFATLYSFWFSTFIAIIPVIAVWGLLHCLYVSFLLWKLISNGIYYVISQFLVLGYIVWRKVESYLWYSHTYGGDLIAAETQQSVLIAELIVAIIGCIIVICTWKICYKE